MRRNASSFSPERVRPLGALLLLIVAVLLILANLIFPQAASSLRSTVVDALSPVLDVFAKPAALLQGAAGNVNDLAHLREENQNLKAEVTNLKAWAQLAKQLEGENKQLKDLLKYKDESVLSYVTARVIGENSGSFSNSVIITAGSRDGVEKDMVALDENGVIGRVIEVGEYSARILLLSDLNFRLPVMVEEARQRAIFTGQGRDAPKLLYIPQIGEVKVGQRVVTSGHGGIFPPGLPVGVVREIQDQDAYVNIYGRLDRLQMVRLARYRLSPVVVVQPLEVPTQIPQTPVQQPTSQTAPPQ